MMGNTAPLAISTTQYMQTKLREHGKGSGGRVQEPKDLEFHCEIL